MLAERDARGVDFGHGAPTEHVHAQPAQRSLGLVREAFREGREHTRPGLDEDDFGLARVDGAKVADQHGSRDVGERARELHAGGAAADDHEGHEGSARRVVRLVLRPLECQEHAPPDLERVLERLQRRRIPLPVLVAEVRIADARGEDQIVVSQRLGVLDANGSRPEIGGRHLAEEHAGIRLAPEDRADRVRDVAR